MPVLIDPNNIQGETQWIKSLAFSMYSLATSGGGGGGGSGDMTKAVYDPAGINGQLAGRAVANTFTALQTVTLMGLGATPSPGYLLQNTTPAALGAQQVSPSTLWSSRCWETTGGTSQAVDFQAFVSPVQGTAASGSWVLQSRINGGAFGNVLTVGNDGSLRPAGNLYILDTIQIGGQVHLNTTGDGRLALRNGSFSSFDLLQYGGITASFPAHKRSGAELQCRLADDSDYAVFSAKLSAPTKITAADYTVGTTDSRELYGGTIYVTAPATITIPAVAVGGSFTVITVGAIAVSVDPNAADLIVLDGTAQADGEKITNLSTAGDIATFTYYDGTGWAASTNGWTNGG